ncbi:NAD-dependent epimerase/dehydratase family protein [bacterium]|nr:MAG: NAD-dependent epimerase/dehydratase family protein [bacterium]
MNGNFWKKKKVLVTGYEGFLGSNLTRELIRLGSDVSGLDILTRRKDTVLSPDLDKVRIYKGSVEDFDLVSKIMRDNKIEMIFHLAATSIVGEALTDPLKAFSTNIRGTWNILEAARNNKLTRAVIIASSDKAYGSQSKLPYREDSPLSGAHPYDASKSCADILASTYYHTYGLPVSVTRCGNIYGPGDLNFSRLVPDALRCISKDKALIIRSDGKFTRDYIYVDDIVNAYLLLAFKMKEASIKGEAFNFSNESPLSVLALLKKLYRCAGIKKADYKITNQAKYEIKHQYLCAAKAKRLLNWRPRYNLEEGLKRTVKWYKDYFAKKY